MGKPSKATRKFKAKHLKSAIQQRKSVQKIKRARREQEAARVSKGPSSHGADAGQPAGAAADGLEDMSIDEFLAGGFLDAQAATAPVSEDKGVEASDSEAELNSDEEKHGRAAPPAPTDRRASTHASQAGRKRKLPHEELPHAEPDSGADHGSDGSSDDDDRAPAGTGRGSAALKAEASAHRAQLEALKQQDPEFYAYLQSTDRELLDFGKHSESEDELEGFDDEGAESAEEGEPAGGRMTSSAQRGGVTLAMVEGWCQAARDKASMGATRNIIKAYRAACHYGDSEEQVEESMRAASSAVYNKLMLFVLREMDGIFRRQLLDGASAKQQQQLLTASALSKLPRWRKVEPLVKSYLGNTLHLLGALTDGAMLTFILRRLRASTVLLAPYEKLQRRLLKAALGLFGSADNAPRVQAILLVRQMALDLPQPALDNCLKGVYRAFSSNAKFVNAASVPQINFMAAAVVEMYGINAAASYQHAFSFIRQLAVLLRSALTSKSKEAYREVYCWQTINCLELWAKLLAARASETELRPLIYPVTQLLLGVARLVPAPAYFPLRLRCARALNRLGEATGTFIPVAPILLEVLQWGDLRKAPKAGTGQHPDVLLQLRVSKANMRSTQYQEEVVNQVMELLAEHLACWGCHIAFPELSFLTLSQLRKFMKSTAVDRFRKAAKQLVEAVEKNVAFVGRARDHVDFSPKDLAQVATFLAKESAAKQAPIQQYARVLLDRARQQLQLRLADTAELGEGVDDGDGDDVPVGSLVPEKRHQHDGLPAAAPPAKRQKHKVQHRDDEAGSDSGSEEGPEDDGELVPLEMSDASDDSDASGDSSDDDESVQPLQHHDRRHQGGHSKAASQHRRAVHGRGRGSGAGRGRASGRGRGRARG